MTISMFSRHYRQPTGGITPARSTSARTMSPTESNTTYSPTITSGGQQYRPNVVTRVAIEGKAKQGQDGASIKMYLKISLQLDGITPGSTIPLFPEENVKILTSQVHPLDNNSVPYNFSSTISPLLHNAARALNLPARSPEAYNSVFGLTPPSTTASITSSRSKSNDSSSIGENVAPIDGQYTGHILVSGYNISYVLPKVFPQRNRGISSMDTDASRPSFKSRRLSVGEKQSVHFMAAVDMWVPYDSRPPRSPYLLSIPTPRCLHNNVKLRIFPPTTTSASFASLSSVEDEVSSWDLTSDPHVTRSASHRPRTNSYTHFADDESSDSSTAGFSDGCGIQGTFPSTERIRVRWAKPFKTADFPGGRDSGRRRVGVKDVRGEMTCIVKGKSRDPSNNGAEGVVMDVEYKGICKGVWFPGVATLLGMDVGLEASGSDVSWVGGHSSEWSVGGGTGYTGFDIGGTSRSNGLDSRTPSFETKSPQIFVSPSTPNENVRPDSSRQSSTSSLLRAPLPAQNITDYSFEGSTTMMAASSSTMGTVSSISSLPPGSTNNVAEPPSAPTRLPGVPITLHINMNDILTPSKNVFTFNISGTILITPRSSNTPDLNSNDISMAQGVVDPAPIVLPRFSVLATDSESTSVIVRNEIDDRNAFVDVYNLTGDIYRDAQAKKTVLQKGGFTKCGDDGGRIALKFPSASKVEGRQASGSGPRTPNGNMTSSNSPFGRKTPILRSKRDGPLMIPSVVTTVTPLVGEYAAFPDGYAVQMCLNAPVNTDSEWLEFGLAQSAQTTPMAGLDEDIEKSPKVEIVSASVDGVPVKFETLSSTREERKAGNEISFEDVAENGWTTWAKIHVGAMQGGAVVIDYTVKRQSNVVSEKRWRKGKAKASDGISLKVYLATFSMPVGRLEVNIDSIPGLEMSFNSNFIHQQSVATGQKFLHYSMREFFFPHLYLTVRVEAASARSFGFTLLTLLPWVIVFVGCFFLHHLGSEMQQIGQSLEKYSVVIGSGWNDVPEPVTVTTTVYTATTKWISETSMSIQKDPITTPPFTPDALPTPLPISADISPPLPSPSPLPPSPSPLPSHTDTTDLQVTSMSASVYLAELYALLPFKDMASFSWQDQDLHSFHVVMDKVLQAADIFWQTLRKAYHYPLDPA